MAKARASRGVQDILGQTIGMAQAGAETLAACLERAGHLSRMVAGQRSGGNGRTPPHSPVVDASASAHDYIKEVHP